MDSDVTTTMMELNNLRKDYLLQQANQELLRKECALKEEQFIKEIVEKRISDTILNVDKKIAESKEIIKDTYIKNGYFSPCSGEIVREHVRESENERTMEALQRKYNNVIFTVKRGSDVTGEYGEGYVPDRTSFYVPPLQFGFKQ